MNRVIKRSLVLTALFCIAFGTAHSQEDAALAKYKALLVYKVSEYIIWPNADGPKTIGVFEDSDIYSSLSEFAAKKEDIKIVKLKTASDVLLCQLVFVSSNHDAELYNYAKAISNNSILLVSDLKKNIHKGADLVVYSESNQLKYIVNDSKISFKGMTPSQKLSALGQSI